MVDVVSIVIAVISLVGSAISAGITALVTLHSDRAKRLSESEKLVSKYRDPLLLASTELQSRLYNILENDFLAFYEDRSLRDLVTLYTAFLVGQYFSWTYILRRKVQFLRFSTDKDTLKLSSTLVAIQQSFGTDSYGQEERLFTLWRGQQMAIGEIMTVMEDGELFCMGYSTFTEKFKSDNVCFREWFHPITEGIPGLLEARSQQGYLPANRLRRLQHLIIDLINILDPPRSEKGTMKRTKVRPAPSCECLSCPSEQSSSSYLRGRP
jgi:hypothetical protein